MNEDRDARTDGPLVAFATRLPDRLAREVRAAAALEGTSVQAWVADALREKLRKTGRI